MDASLSSGEEDPAEASLPLEAAGASSTGWLRDGRIGSVFAPTPWPADTKSMTKADTATASSADTMDTITTPRLNFFLRWRSARARCTTVPPASEVSACGVRPRAAQNGPHARKQLHNAERLCHIIIRAQIKPAYLIVFRRLSRQHDDRCVGQTRRSLEPPQNCKPILARKHDVQKNKSRRFTLRKRLPELTAVGKAAHRVARAFKRIENQLTDALVILNQIDCRRLCQMASLRFPLASGY